MTGFLYPGQGSQAVGMGLDIAQSEPEVASLFEAANQILGRDLRRVIFEGPESELKQTSNTQPALFVMNMAADLAVRKQGWADPAVYAGHSLGEYCALCAAGVFSFEDGLRLVQARADAMNDAALSHPGSMAAVLGLEDALVADACEKASQEGSFVQPANFNSPGQVVISGESAGVEKAMALCAAAGALKCVPLAVSGAFHSRIMQPAGERLRQVFDAVAWNMPLKPVISNVDAEFYTDIQSIRSGLERQVSSPVQWTRSMRGLAAKGTGNLVEVGPGKVLQGLMRKIDKSIPVYSAGDTDSIRKGPPWKS